MLVGCGRADIGSGDTPGTPTASGARTSSPSPAATADETVGWATFNSTAYGYTLKYPPGWVIPASPGNQQSFASENSGGPLGLSPTGIWFYVLITNSNSADCSTTNVAAATTSHDLITVAGTSGTKDLFVDDDGFFDVVVNVWNSRCYDFFFATKGAVTRDSYTHTIELILAHFAFGP
jgi:hypothetical protein